MEELKNLVDIVCQYGGNELVAGGIGAGIGTCHALYDLIKGNEDRLSAEVGGVTAIVSATSSGMSNYIRPVCDGVIGGLTYVAAYKGLSALFSKFR